MRRFLCIVFLALWSSCFPSFAEQTVPAQGITPPTGQQGQPPQPAQPQKEAPKATVRGHVYAHDTGQPLRNAQVSLRGTRSISMQAAGVMGSGAPGNVSYTPSEAVTAITDAQGVFEFRNVEAGTYSLQCTRNGYLTAYYNQSSIGGLGTSMLTVQPGEEKNNADFQLLRGGVIAGTVLDEDGEPLRRAQVSAMSRRFSRGQAQYMPAGSAGTDDRGQYRIFDLTPGKYVVQASSRGYVPGQSGINYAPIFYPNVTAPRDAQRVEVTGGGEVSPIDFRLRAVPTYTLSGRVVDPATGQPVPDARVTLSAANPQESRTYIGGGVMMQRDGAFIFAGLLPGRYRLQVMRPTSTTTYAGGTDRAVTFSGAGSVNKLFDMPASNVKDMLVTLDPPATVRGKIVVDPSLMPPAGGRIQLRPREPGGMYMGGMGNTINADLTFQIENVPAGEYDVSVMLGGAARLGYVSEVRVGGQNGVDKGLSVTGGTSPQIEVVISYEVGSVSGRLTDESDQPAFGMIVLLSSDPQKRALDRFFRVARSKDDGQFSLPGIIPGDYLLLPWADERDFGRSQDPELSDKIEKLSTRVHIEKDGNVTQNLRMTRELRALAMDQ